MHLMQTISVKVLGPGCKNCERVEVHARQAIDQFMSQHPDISISFEKIVDVEKFIDYGLLSTPGLVIDEQLVSSGKIPATADIAAWLEERL
jgi:hypothetical protein